MNRTHSLVLITVDCLRADHVGFNGYDRPTTPFLDDLAAESTIVRNAVVAGSPTYYSFPAILASRHPLALGRDVVGLAPGEPTMASVLNERGYATAAFIAGNPYLSRHFGYDAGFETFQDFLENEPDPSGAAGMPKNSGGSRFNRKLADISHGLGPLGQIYDELYFRYCQRINRAQKASFDQLRRFPAADRVVDDASAWLSGIAGKPFFLWLHLMDPHSPYYPREQALPWMGQGDLGAGRARYLNSYWNRGDLTERRLKRHRQEIIALYDAGIRWVDAQLARLVETLRKGNLWDNCVFALTADHGEEFLEHGGKYHSPAKLSEELVRVPLLLRAPGVAGVRSGNAPFSLLHLAPTLLGATGNPPFAEFRGRSYWEKLRTGQSWNEPAVIESVTTCNNPCRSEDRMGPRMVAVRGAHYQLLLDFRTGQAQLFDLNNDPEQKVPFPPIAERAVRRSLLEVAREHISSGLQSRRPDLRLEACLRRLQLE